MRRSPKQPTQWEAKTLHWVASKGVKRSYELRSGTDVLARMHWPKMIGSLAEAEFEATRWTFKRGGFLRPRVTMRPHNSTEDSAVLELSCGGGGLLRMKNGRCFPWSRKGFWTHRFAFADEKGTELVVIEPKFGLMRRSGAVQVTSVASKLVDLPLLIVLGWYVTMLMADDDAAAIAVCCS